MIIEPEYDPFSHAVNSNNETQKIIEQTRSISLGSPIVREVVHISETSIILMPIKVQSIS